jgi:hypothetical protein
MTTQWFGARPLYLLGACVLCGATPALAQEAEAPPPAEEAEGDVVADTPPSNEEPFVEEEPGTSESEDDDEPADAEGAATPPPEEGEPQELAAPEAALGESEGEAPELELGEAQEAPSRDEAFIFGSGFDPTVPTERPAVGIYGRVVDAESGEGIIEASVELVGRDRSTSSDVDGRFAFALPPGRYVLRTYSPVHELLRTENVVVQGGRVTELSIELRPDPDSVIEVVIEARADTASAATQLQIRRQAAGVQDAISAEEMSRAGGSTASDSVRRVVAATIVDGQYLFVRGLGGRYTNVLLNGTPLPSLDPDIPGVQLDLFPAGLLESIAILKTFTPEIPGNFAGGMMMISTRDFPEQLTLRLGLSLGFDTASTFHDVLGYEGGRLDWLGFDDGTRALPGEVPNERVAVTRNGFSRDEVNEIARSFPNIWQPRRQIGLPNMGLSFSVGDTVALGQRSLGYLWSLTYGHSTRRRQGEVAAIRIEGEGEEAQVALRERLEIETSNTEALWGTLGNVSLELAENHDLALMAMFTQSGEDTARLVEGRLESEGANIRSHQLNFVERSMLFAQLIGDHRELPRLSGSRITWRVDTAWVERDQPDMRDVTYQEGEQGYYWRNVAGSGDRFYSTLEQLDFGGSLDFVIPIIRPTLRFGGVARMSNRDLEARRFSMAFAGASAEDRLLPPEQLFASENIGVLTELSESTRPDDGYEAELRSYAAYVMLDTPIVGPLRMMGGLRFETFDQHVESSSPFARQDDVEGTDRVDYDWLPAGSLIVELREGMLLRAAYGGTVARPLVRELAPFLFQDFVRRRTIQGNPSLERTFIHNADLRWEWFFGETEVFAASIFYKYFSDPIEQIVLDRQGNITYGNVESAQNLGGEIEARLSFGRLHRSLDFLSLGANLTLVYSRVRLSDDQLASATSSERPLAGQSPFVANVSLGFSFSDIGLEANLYYNVFGRRIRDVGRLGLPDVYEEPFHSLDLVISYDISESFRLGFTARNILYRSVQLEQGGIVVSRYNPGISLGVKLGYSYSTANRNQS